MLRHTIPRNRISRAGNDKADGLRAKIADLEKTIETLTADLKETTGAGQRLQFVPNRIPLAARGGNLEVDGPMFLENAQRLSVHINHAWCERHGMR